MLSCYTDSKSLNLFLHCVNVVSLDLCSTHIAQDDPCTKLNDSEEETNLSDRSCSDSSS